MIDVTAFLGRYPFRRAPGGSPQALLEAMDRIGTREAWISNLSAVFWRDPTEGNEMVYSAAAAHPRLRPVPAAHPGLANCGAVIEEAVAKRAPAVRADPTFYGEDPAGNGMKALAAGCAEAGLPLMMTVRLEDVRQRHPHDRAPELSPHAVRDLIRSHPRLRLLVTHADREFIEQVHFGATPAEAVRLLWDICWIWGPPEDHLQTLLRTVGRERFTFGTGMPLRIPETSVARLDLLGLGGEERKEMEEKNLKRWLE
jgi:predicted TIM-barrel fold metal-dependent hydrolase